MASEGPRNPGTMADDNAVGTLTWANPNNAKTSNDVRAIATASGFATSHYLKATNFSFTIPADATIDGIFVEIERHAAGASGATIDSAVKIVKSDGSIGSENKAFGGQWPFSPDQIRSYGSSSDLWSEAWTASDINNSNFGVVLSAQITVYNIVWTAQVDHMKITVYYTEATGTNMQINIGDAWKAVPAMKINIGDAWKDVASAKINIGDAWKTIF